MAYEAYCGDAVVTVFGNDKATALSEGGGNHLTLNLTSAQGSAITSGDVVRVGDIVGVALTDWDAATGTVVISINGGFYVKVLAQDADGDAAITTGTWLYLSADGSTVSANNTGFCIGFALACIAAGETYTIPVKFVPIPWADILDVSA